MGAEDAPVENFVKLTEEHRRDRVRRIDAGDETAQIKFVRPAPVQAKQAPQSGGYSRGQSGGAAPARNGGGAPAAGAKRSYDPGGYGGGNKQQRTSSYSSG